jgi:hypothetical protein
LILAINNMIWILYTRVSITLFYIKHTLHRYQQYRYVLLNLIKYKLCHTKCQHNHICAQHQWVRGLIALQSCDYILIMPFTCSTTMMVLHSGINPSFPDTSCIHLCWRDRQMDTHRVFTVLHRWRRLGYATPTWVVRATAWSVDFDQVCHPNWGDGRLCRTWETFMAYGKVQRQCAYSYLAAIAWKLLGHWRFLRIPTV